MVKLLKIKIALLYLACLIYTLGAVGCAGIEPPNPEKILTHPLGTGPIDLGMTKEEVRAQWGEPDLLRNIGESKGVGSTQKEEWIYYGRVRNLPVSYGYIAKTLYLYFDGENLTSFKEE
jgi:hypothetical protein